MQTISRLRAANFLSLRSVDVSLGGLSVLVGPNGAGKTNILQVFEFLGLVARIDLVPAIEQMGGFDLLLFRGADRSGSKVEIEIEGNITQHASAKAPDRYMLSFSSEPVRIRRPDRALSGKIITEDRTLVSREEEIALKRTPGRGRRITLRGSDMRFGWVGSSPRRAPSTIRVQQSSTGLATLRRLGNEYDADQVEVLAKVFESLRLFEISVEEARLPSAFEEKPKLKHNAGNIAIFLQWMNTHHPDQYGLLCDDVAFVLPSFREFVFEQIGGSEKGVTVSIRESNLSGVTPLSRASFGTLRAIALFAMLHDPDPPRLTCLEEIDHGLHPHALDRIVERLRDASERTQIIAATHSPPLVNRLDGSELVIVERDEETGGSRVFRPTPEVLEEAQSEGLGLGELWFSGALGGGL